jgi:hypothetical protein
VKPFRVFGFVLCFSFLALRIARAESVVDYFVGFGVMGIDCATVEGLARFANRRQRVARAHRDSTAQIVALEQAVSGTALQLSVEQNRLASLWVQLRQRDTEAFDPERAGEEAQWAVESAYLGAINANKRLLEGGAVAALPPRAPTARGDQGENYD